MNHPVILLLALIVGPLLGAAGTCAAQAKLVAEASAASGVTSVRGKRLFLRCSACHSIADSGVARIGPNLQGVLGRKAGTLPDYRYSAAMQAADIIWDETTLDRWLADPTAVIPGTAMAFAGLTNPDDRRAIITYLSSPQR